MPFLQGLITANITNSGLPSAATRPIYTAFFNAQGRVLHEVFLWRARRPTESGEASWLIDVDAASRGSLLAHLEKHKLRSKLKLENVSDEELRIYQGWIDEENHAAREQEEPLDAKKVRHHELGSQLSGLNFYPAWTVAKGIALSDPRPNMGMRWIGTSEETAYDALIQTPAYEQSAYGEPHLVSEDEYIVHRMLHGIAEGQNEIISGSALPQESNIEFFNGIGFRKRCYLG